MTGSVVVRVQAVCIGPPPSLQSYLSIPKIIEVIKKTGAQAVRAEATITSA
jgi:acetyl/propionyl-CoA carboxylase alpha subunit